MDLCISVHALDFHNPWARIREKYVRWHLRDSSKHANIPGTIRQQQPEAQARRAWWFLQKMQAVVSPRVQSAMFSTMWNRWTTTRRFQATSVQECLLGCGAVNGDCVEHYCRCRVVRQICLRQLNVDPDVFASLHAFTLVTPFIKARSSLCIIGLLNYATYSTTNSIRFKNGGRAIDAEVAYDAMAQALREGAKGHAFALKTLRETWNAPVIDSDIPPIPLLPYDGARKRFRQLGQQQSRDNRRRLA